jgi:hypothetical protein
VVASAAPFQRIAVSGTKFVHVTFSVVDCDPAGIVCGRTWVMLGVGAVAGVASCCVGLGEQPRLKRKTEKLALFAIFLDILPKMDLRIKSTCQSQILRPVRSGLSGSLG